MREYRHSGAVVGRMKSSVRDMDMRCAYIQQEHSAEQRQGPSYVLVLLCGWAGHVSLWSRGFLTLGKVLGVK